MGADSYEDSGEYNATAKDYEDAARRCGELSNGDYDGKPSGFALHDSYDRPVVGPNAERKVCDQIFKETKKWDPVLVGRYIEGNVSYNDPEIREHVECLRAHASAKSSLDSARWRLRKAIQECRKERLRSVIAKKRYACKQCKCSGPPNTLLKKGTCRVCGTDAVPTGKEKSPDVKSKAKDVKASERNVEKSWKIVEKSLAKVAKAHKRNSKKSKARAGKVKRRRTDAHEEWLPYPVKKTPVKIRPLRFGTKVAGWVAY